MRFLFLSNFFPRRRPAQAQTRPARTIWRLQYTVSARVFLGMQRSGTRQTLCALVRQRGNGEEVWLALAAIRLLEAKGFSGLALAVLVRALAVIGLSRGPAVQREAPHVDSCRRGSDSRPHRLLDPSACHSVLLQNASLSKPKQVQSQSR